MINQDKSKTMPKVSVVIPAYNSMDYLPQTLDSVLQQTFTNFEVLIVNDGSSDNVEAWAASITDSRVRLISQDNQGVSAARNNGILHAHGEYIAFLDADDLWHPTKLERQVYCLDTNAELGLVDTWVFNIDEKGDKLFPSGISYQEGNVFEDMLTKNFVMCGSSPMLRRSCFDTVGLFNTSLRGPEDWHMWSRISAKYFFKVIEEPLTYYRQHYGSLSTNTESYLIEVSKAIEDIYKSAPSHLKKRKNQNYGNVYYYLASKAYANNKDYGQVIYFCLKVFQNYPRKCFSKDFFRLFFKSLLRM